MKKNFFKRVERAFRSLRPYAFAKPGAGLILGTGLASFAEQCRGSVIPYSKVPGFPQPTVPGHKSYLKVNPEQGLALLSGRIHYYEGRDMDDIVLPVFLLAKLGVKILIITNASGSINPAYAPGDFVLIRDHINLLGNNPLRGFAGKAGPGGEEKSPFIDMRAAYSSRLRNLVQKQVQPELPAGVYAALSGPSFETPAEVRMLDRLGADMVGMSTVPEVLAARYLGLEVLGVSLITNKALAAAADTDPAALTPVENEPLSHAENLRLGAQRSAAFGKLMKDILSVLGYTM